MYLLPFCAAVAFTLGLPPFSLSISTLVSLILFYIFLAIETHTRKTVFWGSFLFGSIPAAYLSYMTLVDFNWLAETYLFSGLVKSLFIPTIMITGVICGTFSLFFTYLLKQTRTIAERIFLFGFAYTIIEFLLTHVLHGFNYGSIAYAFGNINIILPLASYAGVAGISLFVTMLAAILGEILLYVTPAVASENVRPFFGNYKRSTLLFAPLLIFIGFLIISADRTTTSDDKESLSVAIIQSASRDPANTFGKNINDIFSFPDLEDTLFKLRKEKIDLLVYPFSPWNGVLGREIDHALYKNTVTLTETHFGLWEKQHVSPETTLVTWNTTRRAGKYYEEFNFWKNGHLIGILQKQRLFPFMDYTPEWAEKIGLYSTSYDATPGILQLPPKIKKTQIESFVCSELAEPRNGSTATNSNLLLAIGSEAMFTNSLAGTFNLLNAKLRAAETSKPMIRGDKFGPSGIIDASGALVANSGYDTSTVIRGVVEISTTDKKTPYEKYGDFPYIVLTIFYFILAVIQPAKKLDN